MGLAVGRVRDRVEGELITRNRPARPPRRCTPNYTPCSVAHSVALLGLCCANRKGEAGGKRALSMGPLSHKAFSREYKVGQRAYARGLDVPSIRPDSPTATPLYSDVNNVNGPKVKLICHAGPQ